MSTFNLDQPMALLKAVVLAAHLVLKIASKKYRNSFLYFLSPELILTYSQVISDVLFYPGYSVMLEEMIALKENRMGNS